MSKIFIARAKNFSTEKVRKFLSIDPYQKRTSLYPILLTHPRTNKTMVLSEYVNEIDSGSRFAIECDDKKLIFVSRMENSSLGQIFLATGEGRFKWTGAS